MVRLGVNIDHVATLKRLRDTPYPDLLLAARECVAGGAEQITIHLREDRRHIEDADVARLRAELSVDLNLEMAATEEMLAIALKTKPHSICVVPEKREERTTEGGLDVANPKTRPLITKICAEANAKGILTSLFIEPDAKAVRDSKELGARAVELHTGTLCIAEQSGDRARADSEWARLKEAVAEGNRLGMLVHAGHGIDIPIAKKLAKISGIVEYNIGHAIVCHAVMIGIREATRRMKEAIQP